MTYHKSGLRNLVKTLIAVHLAALAIFGMVKCTRINVFSGVHGYMHVTDTELLFHLGSFTKLKNIAYNAYKEASSRDDEVEFVVFSPLDRTNNIRIYRSGEKAEVSTAEDGIPYFKAWEIYNTVMMHNLKSSGEGGLLVEAFDDTVVLSAYSESGVDLVYTASGMYPDRSRFTNPDNIEFVRISLHWFHCYRKRVDFWRP